MKKIDLVQVITILANIGVIAGIVFLAIEVGQNQASLDEQNVMSRQAAADGALDSYGRFRELLLQNPELIELDQKARADERLTETEWRRWSLLCQQDVWIDASAYLRFGSIGQQRAADQSVRKLGSSISQSENYRNCWEDIKPAVRGRGYFEFVEAVDSLVGEL